MKTENIQKLDMKFEERDGGKNPTEKIALRAIGEGVIRITEMMSNERVRVSIPWLEKFYTDVMREFATTLLISGYSGEVTDRHVNSIYKRIVQIEVIMADFSVIN